jgi:ribonuclease VapC
MVVLDASALLALLLGEPGGERVAAALAEAAMSTVNLGEVIGHLTRKGMEERDVREALGPLPIEWMPFDSGLAYAAGLLISKTRTAGLSLGDRACLVLAQRLGVKALTADRAWAKINQAAGVEIELVR